MADNHFTSYRKKPLPPDDVLLTEARRIYKYDEENGGLIWIARTNQKRNNGPKLGKPVGGDDGSGYLMCLLLGHKFKVHQIVWLMCKGEYPRLMIDHANRNKRDNRIENLRLATTMQNGFNRSTIVANKTGVYPSRKGYCAHIGYKAKKLHLGYFKTFEAAAAAYHEASEALRGEFSPI